MSRETTNSVRQVLMNELGLTREVIRKEMTNIIAAECEKAVAMLATQGTLERLVHSEFNKLVSGKNIWSETTIASIVRTVAEKIAREYVQNNIQFSCKESGGGQSLHTQ